MLRNTIRVRSSAEPHFFVRASAVAGITENGRGRFPFCATVIGCSSYGRRLGDSVALGGNGRTGLTCSRSGRGPGYRNDEEERNVIDDSSAPRNNKFYSRAPRSSARKFVRAKQHSHSRGRIHTHTAGDARTGAHQPGAHTRAAA